MKVLRGVGEILFALALGLYAAETWTHRSFSPDPRYKAVIGWFAVLIASLGVLPLLLHFLPRTGRVAALVWIALLVVLAVIGFLTKP